MSVPWFLYPRHRRRQPHLGRAASSPPPHFQDLGEDPAAFRLGGGDGSARTPSRSQRLGGSGTRSSARTVSSADRLHYRTRRRNGRRPRPCRGADRIWDASRARLRRRDARPHLPRRPHLPCRPRRAPRWRPHHDRSRPRGHAPHVGAGGRARPIGSDPHRARPQRWRPQLHTSETRRRCLCVRSAAPTQWQLRTCSWLSSALIRLLDQIDVDDWSTDEKLAVKQKFNAIFYPKMDSSDLEEYLEHQSYTLKDMLQVISVLQKKVSSIKEEVEEADGDLLDLKILHLKTDIINMRLDRLECDVSELLEECRQKKKVPWGTFVIRGKKINVLSKLMQLIGRVVGKLVDKVIEMLL